MDELSYEVRVMRKEDIPQALDICKEVGLRKGTQCLYTWLEVDPLGFQVAAAESGEILGVCSALYHHEDLAFVGIYAVRQNYRGMGIGMKLWNACMEHIGERNAALNAARDKLALYRDRAGFPLVESEWTNLGFNTVEDVDPLVLLKEVEEVDVRKVEDDDFPMIMDYDFELMGYKRQLAISLTLKEKDSQSFIALQNGKCMGYGTIKTSCYGGGLVGPLYAESTEVAEVLLRHLILSLPDVKGFTMMTISANLGARAIVDKLKVPLYKDGPRCYKKSKFNVNISKVFGLFDISFSPY